MKTGRIADVVLGGAGAACLLVLAYAVLNHERYFVIGPRLVVFYLLPLVLAAALFASMRLAPDRKLKLAVLLVTSGICVYGLEAFATLWSRQAKVRRAGDEGRETDGRTKLAVVRDLRDRGVDAYPSVYPLDLVRDWLRESAPFRIEIEGADVLPLGGISRKPTVLCNEGGVYEIYEADEHGFRNPVGIWTAPQHPLAVVGDSFAQGYCVPTGAGPVDRLRGAYPGALNLGMQGNGPLLELASLREFLPSLKPPAVLWFYFEGNDLGVELPLEERHPLLRRYLEDAGFRQDLTSKQASIDEGLVSMVDRRMAEADSRDERITLQDVVKFAKLSSLRNALGLGVKPARVDLDTFREILTEARRTIGSWGGELYFVYLPEIARYKPSLLERDDAPRARVLEIVEDLGVPLIDLHESFSRDPEPLRFFADYHYNQAGYDRLADLILQRLGDSDPAR